MKQLIFLLTLSCGIGTVFSQSFYDNSNITKIEIFFSTNNWDQLLDSYYAAGLEQRLLADSVVINGSVRDSVGVRYKGNSTYNPNNAKNPINISLDYIKDNQDYQGFRTIKLSNGKNDPSFVREVLSYEIARKYMVAPQSNFAEVHINGVYHGLYANTESINSDFNDKLYADIDNTRIKCNPQNLFSGNGSSLEYLGPDSSLYNAYYELKSDYGWNDLVDLTFYLDNPSVFDPSLLLDIDKAIWMLAFNNALVNLDSYIGPFRQNYYLIKDDNNRFNTILWDLNESFGGFEMINSGPTTIQDLIELDPFLRQNDPTWPLIKFILENDTYRKMYVAHLRTILNENFSNNNYLSRASDLQALINNSYISDPNTFYSITEFNNNLSTSVGSGPSSAIGISQLMNDRVSFLYSQGLFSSSNTPVINSITTLPSQVTPYSSPDILVEASNANKVIFAYRFRPQDKFISVEMFDDGQNNDGIAGDDVYGISIPVDARDLQYYIYAENNTDGIFSPERAEHEYHSLPVVSDLVINELMASNNSSVADQNGEYDDWVELYNSGNIAISLAGFYLSDNENILDKWQFPSNITIQPNDYIIVWLDGDDGLQSGLHSSFKLSSGGEELFLSTPALDIVDAIFFPSILTDISYARVPNGNGPFILQTHTFESNNSIGTFVDDKSLNSLIYPNPANNYFKIKTDQESTLKIYNSLGRLIANQEKTTQTTINCVSWPSGIYFVKIGQQIHKLIKL